MPLTTAEYDYVIVDNGAANPGELAENYLSVVSGT
jgi:hypothetical protein